MTSAVNKEFLALCACKHLMGSAFTPRQQGPGERAHQTLLIQHLLLMNAVCKAFPQKWPSLVPALEYLIDTAPRPPYELSAWDLANGHALASNADNQLAPFTVPTPAADWCVNGRTETHAHPMLKPMLSTLQARRTGAAASRPTRQHNGTSIDLKPLKAKP